MPPRNCPSGRQSYPPNGPAAALPLASGLRYTLGMIITIDGPAGSGKSTVARGLAAQLGIAYLDTGATYRAMTLKAMRSNVDLQDETSLAPLANKTDIQLVPRSDGVEVILDGQDVSQNIRSTEVSDNSHHIARSPAVREVLVALQRRLGHALGEFVAEGRDQGSVVFPDADVKFYLDASPQVRAMRRYRELMAAGQEVDYVQVLQGIIKRDGQDKTRSVAPLVRPEGAIMLDTSDMTIDEVIDELIRHVEQKF